jgi:hypothetical protein
LTTPIPINSAHLLILILSHYTRRQSSGGKICPDTAPTGHYEEEMFRVHRMYAAWAESIWMRTSMFCWDKLWRAPVPAGCLLAKANILIRADPRIDA